MRKSIVYILLIILSASANSGSLFIREVSDFTYEENFIRYIDVPAVAISPDYTTGILGRIRIGIRPGVGNIFFDDRTQLDDSAKQSAIAAVSFAEKITGQDQFDYYITYDINSELVSGSSTGSVVGYGLIALLSNKTVDSPVLLTGEIDENGNLLETGGIPVKVKTAVLTGVTVMIIPPNQSVYYGFSEAGNNAYISEKINLT